MKKAIFRKIGAIFIIIIVAVALWFIMWYSASQKPKSLKMGYAPFASNWPFFIAIDKGYFKDEGLDIEEEKFMESKSMMDALIAKRVDAIAPVALPVIFGVAQNQPELLKLYLIGAERNKPESFGIVSGIIVKKDSPINSISELRGRKIGTYTGTAALVSTKLILLANGIDPEKEVSIIQVSSEFQIPSLLTDQFDALFTIEPYVTVAIEKDIGKLIEANPRSKYIQDPYIMGGQVCLREFVEKNPEACEKIDRALKRAINFIKENPEEARKILAKWTVYEKEIAMQVGLYEWTEVSPQTTTSLQKMADIFYKYEMIKTPIDVSKLVK